MKKFYALFILALSLFLIPTVTAVSVRDLSEDLLKVAAGIEVVKRGDTPCEV